MFPHLFFRMQVPHITLQLHHNSGIGGRVNKGIHGIGLSGKLNRKFARLGKVFQSHHQSKDEQ